MRIIKIAILLSILIGYTDLLASEKSKILNSLKGINNIQFNFIQKTNNSTEKGFCTLVFPGKLKCSYKDKDRKELIVNGNMMAITQKRYDKTFFYPLSKSNFINILSKEKLIKIIKSSDIIIDDYLNIIFIAENYSKTLIKFNKENFLLAGWVSLDQYNNEIIFNIDIKSTNKMVDEKIFILPKNS